jgi:hypothetical protein
VLRALRTKTTLAWEAKLEKVYAAARALALILAIVFAFVAMDPAITTTLLLVLGGLSAVNEDNIKTFLTALVLIAGSSMLADIPQIGMWLMAIFHNIGVAAVGGSIVAVTLMILLRIKSDWVR